MKKLIFTLILGLIAYWLIMPTFVEQKRQELEDLEINPSVLHFLESNQDKNSQDDTTDNEL